MEAVGRLHYQGSQAPAVSAREEDWDLCEDLRDDRREDFRSNPREDARDNEREYLTDDLGGDLCADVSESLRDDWITELAARERVVHPESAEHLTHPGQLPERALVALEQSGRPSPPLVGGESLRVGPAPSPGGDALRIGPAPSESEVTDAARQLQASIQSLPSHSVSANQLVADVRRRAVQEGGRDRRVLVVSQALEMFSRDADLQ
ncbi:hypothetical protein CLOM_g11087 [Closterium sp. NIES-68]|nr:hypothetical protein CLOM_g11087 [Closterium sp. NIES-68]